MLSVKEAAQRLGRSERTVVHLLNTGKLTGSREGRRWLVDESSLVQPSRTSLPLPNVAEEPADTAPATISEEPDLADSNGKKWSYRHLAAFDTLFPVVRNALSLLHEQSGAIPEPLATRAWVGGCTCLERLSAGYHAYRHRDKISCYVGAREAVMCFSVDLYLAGHLSGGRAEGLKRYAVQVERAGSRLSGLIRILEKKHDPER